MTTGRGIPRYWLAALAVGVLLVQALARPSVAAAASPPSISYVSQATYELRPDKRVVHVTASIVATGNSSDTASGRSFWEGVRVSLPPSTANFVATAGQNPLALSVRSRAATEVLVAVGFGRRIYSGQTFAFELQFDIVDKGTEPDRDPRITRTLSTFGVFALASPGTSGSSVEVVFPAGYRVTEESGQLALKPNDPRGTVFAGTSLPEANYFSWFSAETTPRMVERKVSVGPLNLTIRGWDDDQAWSDRIERVFRGGYPIMREEIGLGEAASTNLTIEEATLAESNTYSGSYEPAAGRVKISYLADPFTILHEMAHLWFNPKLVSDWWIEEGFASLYAEQVMTELNLSARIPSLNGAKLAARIPLADWTPSGQATLQDQFAYAASLQAAELVRDTASDDGLRAVWSRIRSGSLPYSAAPTSDAGHTASRASVPATSTSLLDFLQQTTGESYDEIWHDWVFDQSQLPLLDQRAKVLGEYADAVTQARDWSIPEDVRAELRNWDFNAAESDLATIRSVLATRTRIEDGVAAESTKAPAALRTAFEAGVEAGAREAAGEMGALDALSAARIAEARDAGAARAVGLIGVDPRVELKAARTAFGRGDWQTATRLADEARAGWEGALSEGRNRLLLVAVVGSAATLALFAVVLYYLPWRSARRRAARVRGEGAAEPAGSVEAGESSIAGSGRVETEVDGVGGGGANADGTVVGAGDGDGAREGDGAGAGPGTGARGASLRVKTSSLTKGANGRLR